MNCDNRGKLLNESSAPVLFARLVHSTGRLITADERFLSRPEYNDQGDMQGPCQIGNMIATTR